MATELTPAMLRSVQRLAQTARIAAISDHAETQLRNGAAVDIRAFATSYYPLGFVTGNSVSIRVLQWLFPSSDSDLKASDVTTPLGELTQIFLITDGLLKHTSSRYLPDALDVVLSARVFVEDSEPMTPVKRQRALDEALRCARDTDTSNILIAHGADPQTVKLDFRQSPWGPSSTDPRLSLADSYVANGVFLVGDDTILASHLNLGCLFSSVRTFVRAGVDTTKALPTAAKRRRLDTLRTIVEGAAVDIDYCPTDDGRTSTALIEAVVSKSDVRGAPTRAQVVAMLLRLGADVNASGRNNETALTRAATAGDESVVEVLLQHGADPNLHDQDGKSPLHLVCKYRFSNNRRINPHVEDVDVVPLYESPRVISLLLQRGADPNKRDREGKTPLHILVDLGNPQSISQHIKVLISNGADVYTHDDSGLSLLTQLAQDPDGVKLIEDLSDSGLLIDQPYQVA